jgi:hypothetical protein
MLLFATLAALSYGKVVVKGESNTPFGAYTIEILDQPMMLGGEEMKCYLISYENTPLQAKVFVDKVKGCKNYVVVTDELSVMYTCNGKYFGVNKVGKKYKEAGIVTDDARLDRTDYFRQKLITQGETAEFDATALIASYFPALLD